MGTKVGVIGSGSWGTAMAATFADSGCDVTIWSRDENVVDSINKENKNPKYVSDFTLNSALKAELDLPKVLSQSEVVVCAIPTQQIRKVFEPHHSLLEGKSVVNTSKGLELGTHLRVSEIFQAIAPKANYMVLSGPSFAKEVLQKMPTAVTLASTDLKKATPVQHAFATPYFRLYTSDDVVGAELGGSLKNVMAIATGMAAGLGLGMNTQAAIINRGVAEILRTAKAEGASPMTFLGLSGMGDLILTCTGDLSRNRRLGILVGQGKDLEQAKTELGGVAEGAYTVKAAVELAKVHKVEMPITEQVARILYDGQDPKAALTELMQREPKVELS